MAIVCDSISIVGMRKAHFRQLLDYINEREREGWYYGNKAQYEKRHVDIKTWMENVVETLEQEGTIIPKT